MKAAVDIIYFLRKKLGLKSNVALAELLRLKPASFRTALHRSSIPYEKIITLAEEKEISLNEMFFEKDIDSKNKEVLNSYEKTLIKCVREKMKITFSLFLGEKKLLVYPKLKFKNMVVTLSKKEVYTPVDAKIQLSNNILKYMLEADTLKEKLFDKNQFQTLLQELIDNYDENEIFILIKYVDEVLDFITD